MSGRRGMYFMDERELMDMKFFDYRALEPEVATLVFMANWAQAFCNYNEDIGYTKHFAFLKGFKSFDLDYLRTNSHFKTLNELRKIADKHGARYDLFWQWAFEAHTELSFQNKMVNTFKNKNIQAKILDKKRAHEKTFITYAKSDIFKPENYRNLELQNDYCWYLIREIKNRYAKETWQGKILTLVENNRLPKDFFCNHYSVST
jgi:hypothetical protein